MYADDTIAAIATPMGPGGVGIVRLSGPLCAAIAAEVFSRQRRTKERSSKDGAEEWVSHHLYSGAIVDGAGNALDSGLAVFMRRPRSYTGEDVLELHCHGSPVGLRRVLARVLSCGARAAEKGEFTKRAFLNGRLDLAQAEAVIEMVRARTDAGATVAAQQLSGRLSEHLTALRARLIDLRALLEAQIDFSEEDFHIDTAELVATLDDCTAAIRELLDTYRHGKLIRDGLRVAIIGKPNVGKSSLLNALLGEERAIVTPLAGTTRDSIDETADFDGLPVVLSDTAGLRAHDDAELVERLGMQRTQAKVAEADMVLTVLDASQPLDHADHQVLETAGGMRQIIVLNKIDLDPKASLDTEAIANGHAVVCVSATQRLGLAELRRAVVVEATGETMLCGNLPVLTNVRHHDALAKASKSLQLARQSLLEARPADLVAVDVQNAVDDIATVTGAITTEDVLDRIFAEFCIGK